jgi:hypothetical protein
VPQLRGIVIWGLELRRQANTLDLVARARRRIAQDLGEPSRQRHLYLVG